MVSSSSIQTTGSADAILSASFVKKARYVHQVNAAVLHSLLMESYDANEQSYDVWLADRRKKSPNFEYWFRCVEIECLMLLFVQNTRSGNFEMFVGVLDQFAPWLFALDHTNYARWLPVFIRSLETLPQQHPNVDEQFLKGRFTTQKEKRKFSRSFDDHAHEQNNKIVKGTGGAIGIFDSPIALAKWMIAGHEIARMLKNFEDSFNDEIKGIKSNNETKHHENTTSFKKMF